MTRRTLLGGMVDRDRHHRAAGVGAAGVILRRPKAGDDREVAGVKLCWCPPGRFIDGQPAQRTRTAAGRRPGRSDADPGLLDGEVRGDARPVETGRRRSCRAS